MTSTEIVKRLRALALEIENANPFSGASAAQKPSQKVEPAAVGAADLTVVVGYWQVKDTATGKPMGKLGYTDEAGERIYLPCFDEKVPLAVDPLQKGETVELVTKPWRDTKAIVSIRRVQGAARPTGIVADEIPF